MNNYDRALACAARGWLVFPSYGKRPLVRWSQEASKDVDVLKVMWDTWPDADVCVKTGEGSNLVVVDWDAYKQDQPDRWPLSLPLPETYTTQTGKGGFHFYFTHPGYPVANSAGLLAEFVDVRGDGGMVVAYPPIRDVNPAPVPVEWAQARRSVVDVTAVTRPPRPFQGVTMWANNIRLARLADLRYADEGKRNAVLYGVASDLYKLVWAGSLDREEITQTLGDTALEIGLQPHEIAATLASAMRNGASQYEKGNA